MKIWVIIAAMLLLGACNFFRAPGKHECEKILSRDEMFDILTDIYILEAYLIEYAYFERRIRDSANYYYAGIFDRHQVDPADFEQALSCYLLDRGEMDMIHEQMLNHLSILESEAFRPSADPESEEDFPGIVPE